MKLGIMQPYFFPYIGYFSLIKYTDKFVFFDSAQYIYHGWVNRNRVLKQGGDTTYITVPVKQMSNRMPIKDVKIDFNQHWKLKIIGQLSHYKNKAPFYEETISIVRAILDKHTYSLSGLCIDSVKNLCDWLGLKKDFKIYSQMNLSFPMVKAPDEWALYITKELGGDIYVNLPGGKSFFDTDKYKKAGIKIEFLETDFVPYIQRNGQFVHGLSIIDVMMFCRKEEILKMLDNYTIS